MRNQSKRDCKSVIFLICTVLLGMASWAPVATAGDSICPSTDLKWSACFDSLTGVEAAVASVDDLTQDLSLGVSAPSGASTRADFLHRFLAAVDIPGLTEKDGLLSFRYNSLKGALGIAAIANKPVLFEKLKLSIPEENREAKASELDKTLKEFDDVNFTVSVNIRPPGSRLRPKLNSIATALAEDAIANTESELPALASLVRALNARGLSIESKVKDAGVHRVELEAFLKGAVEVANEADAAFEAGLGRNSYFKLADLAANQPQFSLDIKARNRDDLVGPDEVEGALVWQIGLGPNLNALSQYCKTKGLEMGLECYQKFLNLNGIDLERKWRLKVEASYKATDRYDSPVEGITLHLDKAESIIAKATWGGILTFQEVKGKTVELNSFALEASYEDVTGDEERQNRFVATATLTQRVNDDMSLQISAVWANKPQYRGEVDEEVSARAGVRYKFNTPK